MSFAIGELVVVVGGPEFGIGRMGLVMSAPYPIGPVVDPRSTWFDMPADTLVQDLYVRGISEAYAANSGGALHIAYPPGMLEPLPRDSAEAAEWTAELRALCKPRELAVEAVEAVK